MRGRVNDRLGLVVFAGESYTQCPLTLDYGIFLSFLNEVRLAEDSWDGTAIGTGIVTAVNRLRRSEAKSRVIILLTDGVTTGGKWTPLRPPVPQGRWAYGFTPLEREATG